MSRQAGGGDWPPLSPLRTGLACRCPRCGRGRLFGAYLKVVDHCAACGLDLRAHDSGDGPAVFIVFILGFVVVGLAVLVEVAMQPPIWLHMVLWTTAVLGGTFALLPPLKAMMVAQQYRHRSTVEDE